MEINNEENEDKSAFVKYRLVDGELKIDIEIDNFDEESMDTLGELCASIASEQISYETVSHIRDLLIQHDQAALLVPFVKSLNENSNVISKLFNSTKEQDKDNQKPCILPSDMM
tara:strand:+ start:341 stop:682 length:342 start_codon:yes stop_codon:yes gene_type:complete